jgi:uncharacterized membrane protein
VGLARWREITRTGLWFVPSLFTLGVTLLAAVTITIDSRVDSHTSPLAFSGGATSASDVLSTIATSTLTFTALVFSITIVALQLASSQFSPRVLRAFLRDRGSQVSLGVFVATFVYAFIALQSVRAEAPGVEEFVPGYTITVSFVLVFASLATFVYYVDHVAHAVRAVSVIEAVARETRAAIEANFPLDAAPVGPDTEIAPPDQVIVAVKPGVIVGYDEDDLVAVAAGHDCLLRLIPGVGDYVPTGGPLVAVHGATKEVDPGQVLPHIGFRAERTMDRDVAFGFRQLVDVAEKALSPAINDPTTAVQAVDRLHDFLRRIVGRPWPSGRIADDAGRVRFEHPVMSWDEFVTLAFAEIRLYGAGSVQVARRLRSVLVDLIACAPPERTEPLEREMRLLDAAIDRGYHDQADRDFARRPEAGGRTHDPA